jgi:hypothetical protein
MSDLIIYINDEALDLSESQVIAITKQAAKVGDFSKVLADGTNQIAVPMTAKNKAILDNSQLVQTESSIPYSRLTAKMVQEGIETIAEGFAIIETVEDKKFNIQIVGGNASFFNLIKDKNLRDLKLVDFGQYWTNQNVIDSQTSTSGFIYALFEQSQQDQDTGEQTLTEAPETVHTELLLPCFFVKDLLDRIFSEQGFDFVCDIQSLTIFENLVVFAASTPNRGEDMSHHNCTISNDADYLSDQFGSHFLFPAATVEPVQTPYTAGADFQASLQLAADSKFVLTDSTNVTVTVNLILETATAGTQGFIGISYTREDGMQGALGQLVDIPLGVSQRSETFTFNCSKWEFENNIFFQIEFFSGFVPTTTIKAGSTFTVTANSLISNTAISTVFPYNYFTGSLPVPNMSQVDFLKDFARVFQLVFDTNDVNGVVTAKRFDQIKENIPLAVDYSAKLQEGSQQLKFTFDGAAKRNLLKWKPDNITGFNGQEIIFVDNENLPFEKTLVEVQQFAATSNITKFSTSVPSVGLFAAGVPSNETTDRMFVIRRVTAGSPIDFDRNGSILSTSDISFAYFSLTSFPDSLDFITLKQRFFLTIEQMMQNCLTITADFNLGISDIYNYNPFLPVYVQKFNSYFYLEKIENYLKGKLTKIKLIKL